MDTRCFDFLKMVVGSMGQSERLALNYDYPGYWCLNNVDESGNAVMNTFSVCIHFAEDDGSVYLEIGDWSTERVIAQLVLTPSLLKDIACFLPSETEVMEVLGKNKESGT